MTKISIDSLKVRIPISLVEIVNPSLNETRYEVNEYGDVLKEWKSNKLHIENNGCSTYYGIQTIKDAANHSGSYLVILLNSKLLGELYFEGITKGNIDGLYQKLMDHSVVKFSKDNFLNAECTDIDFKKDIVSGQFGMILKHVTLHAKQYAQKDKGYKLYNSVKNKGIDFGKRATATPAYPFLKMYQKYSELKYASTKFRDAYNLNPDKNLTRIEFTIKNKAHFKKYKIEQTTLQSLLDIKQEKLERILSNICNIHLSKRTHKKNVKMAGVTPTNIVHIKAISTMVEYGLNIDSIIHNLTIDIDDKSTRSRTKSKLQRLYDSYIKETSIAKATEAMSGYFKELGWN